jgi:rhodanese-related sulfurtransferase
VREHIDEYRRALAERGLKLRMIFETHTHADHRMLNAELKPRLAAPVIMHRESPIPTVDRHVIHGDRLDLGGETIQVIHTPGHTPDSMCLRLPGAVLTGDTLLIGGSGRTDFPGGDAAAQYDAVTQRLFTLPEETVVWPAHDYKGRTSSTIGDEVRTNPRFLGCTRDQYVQVMGSLGLPYPDHVQEALQVNQSGFEANEVVFPHIEEISAVPELEAAEVERRLAKADAPIVIDVREPEEFVGELGHIAGALLIPLDAIEHRLPKLAGYHDRDIVIVCRAGARSASAGAILRRHGFARVTNLHGGMLAWTKAGLPVQK